ncbi:MAG TPA: hypothetical protein VFY71_05955 [Planctomycetota bacterium]|nr:hypothetical protein [Planctomycetota bacterium]
MSPPRLTVSDAVAPDPRHELLRCPSCCQRIPIGYLPLSEWRVLHRCGQHVLEATTHDGLSLSLWRWRAAHG